MRRAPIALAPLVALTLVLASARGAEPILPTPPRQAEPWTAPMTTLPRFLVSATAALPEQGLADPRGCDRRVSIEESVSRGRAGFRVSRRAHAPGSADPPRRSPSPGFAPIRRQA